MARRAAGLQNAGRGVHRVADQRDLSPHRPKLADRDRAAMEARAKVGNDAKVALVREALRGDLVVGGESVFLGASRTTTLGTAGESMCM